MGAGRARLQERRGHLMGQVHVWQDGQLWIAATAMLPYGPIPRHSGYVRRCSTARRGIAREPSRVETEQVVARRLPRVRCTTSLVLERTKGASETVSGIDGGRVRTDHANRRSPCWNAVSNAASSRSAQGLPFPAPRYSTSSSPSHSRTNGLTLRRIETDHRAVVTSPAPRPGRRGPGAGRSGRPHRRPSSSSDPGLHLDRARAPLRRPGGSGRAAILRPRHGRSYVSGRQTLC